MASYESGKKEVCKWIRDNFRKGSTCLDVGACDGNWYERLGDWLEMDAVEIFEPYIEANDLRRKYNRVFTGSITDYEYDHYDLIIFGDVIEHMTVEQAHNVLAYARVRCDDMIVAVPYLYEQGPINGNEHETHVQPELTEELFKQRYPGFKILHKPNEKYCYWHVG